MKNTIPYSQTKQERDANREAMWAIEPDYELIAEMLIENDERLDNLPAPLLVGKDTLPPIRIKRILANG